jgi:hypothetical protein
MLLKLVYSPHLLGLGVQLLVSIEIPYYIHSVEVTVVSLRFEVLTATKLKIRVFWNVTTCTSVSDGSAASIFWAEEGFSKMLVPFVQATQHHVPESNNPG